MILEFGGACGWRGHVIVWWGKEPHSTRGGRDGAGEKKKRQDRLWEQVSWGHVAWMLRDGYDATPTAHGEAAVRWGLRHAWRLAVGGCGSRVYVACTVLCLLVCAVPVWEELLHQGHASAGLAACQTESA